MTTQEKDYEIHLDTVLNEYVNAFKKHWTKEKRKQWVENEIKIINDPHMSDTGSKLYLARYEKRLRDRQKILA